MPIDYTELAQEFAQHPATENQNYYEVYSISLKTGLQLSLPECQSREKFDIELQVGPPSLFSEAIHGVVLKESKYANYFYAHLHDGSSYVRWSHLGEFLVSADGRRIMCRWIGKIPSESFQVYLLGQALSFALVKKGFEPLHATAVEMNGEAVVFLGTSGLGKSSLAGYLIQAGHRLITDDMLMLRKNGAEFQACPGPARIKLFPSMAKRFLGILTTGVPMNRKAEKLILPLNSDQRCPSSIPLKAIYTLFFAHVGGEGQPVKIEPMSSREGFVHLVSHTFNYLIVDKDRLHRQFTETAAVAAAVPVKKLIYSRRFSCLTAVRQAILDDLSQTK